MQFRAAAQSCPQEPSLLAELTRALTLARKFEDAMVAVRELLAVQPHSEPGLILLANLQLMTQQFEASQATIQRVLRANPKNTVALQIQGNLHYLRGRDQEAIDSFIQILQLEPQNEEATYELGRVYYQLNRFQPAMGQFKRVIQLNPKSHKAYDNLGLCYEALSQDELAIQHYLKALDLVHKDHPEYDWPYANLANLLLKRDENEKAFQLAAEAAERNPSSARNFYLAGKALSRLDKAEAALKWLQRSVELDQNYPDPRYLLGQIYVKLGRKEDAERELKAFREIQAKQPRQRR
jgi:tetratricopeptide (TPR) repeat protein